MAQRIWTVVSASVVLLFGMLLLEEGIVAAPDVIGSVKSLTSSATNHTYQNDGKLRCTFFGTSSFAVQDGDNRVLIDAFFSRPSLIQTFFGKIQPNLAVINSILSLANIDKADALFVAHSHYDHVLDAPIVSNLLQARMYGSHSTSLIGQGNGLAANQMQIIKHDDVFDFGKISIRVFEGEHSPGNIFPGNVTEPIAYPAKASTMKDGGCFSFLITHPAGTVLVHPSANFVTNRFEHVRADLLFLGIGALGSQTEGFRQTYWDQTVNFIKPSKIIPIHFDSFFRPLSWPLKPLSRPFDKFKVAKGFLDGKSEWDITWPKAFESFTLPLESA